MTPPWPSGETAQQSTAQHSTAQKRLSFSGVFERVLRGALSVQTPLAGLAQDSQQPFSHSSFPTECPHTKTTKTPKKLQTKSIWKLKRCLAEVRQQISLPISTFSPPKNPTLTSMCVCVCVYISRSLSMRVRLCAFHVCV